MRIKGSRSTPKQMGLVLMFLSVFVTDESLGFSTRPAFGLMCSSSVSRNGIDWCHRQSNGNSRLAMDFSLAEDLQDLKPEANNKKKEDPMSPFEVGTVVRIVAEGLKAYQVAPKGFGSYDADKNFVPVTEEGDRATKNLKVPVGMRGVVTKVYKSKELSANFPIQIKFEPGKHGEEGFDPPVSFLFHLSPQEVEAVE